MTGDRPAPAGRQVDGRPVRLVCSCVRDPATALGPGTRLATGVPGVRPGDLVLVRCLSDTGAYDHVEDEHGTDVRLRAGDEFVAVLGTRRSGTNLTGEVPDGPLRAGRRLDLVAQGGLVAVVGTVPAYYGRPALAVEVVAVPTDARGQVRNLDDAPVVPVGPDAPVPPAAPLLVVCGTSAEVGKTTLAGTLCRVVTAERPDLRTAAIKACGTGRARDLISHREAGYGTVTDFVDAGLASTYGVPAARFRAVLATLLRHCDARADLLVVEVGGDLLEACAPEALVLLAGAGAEFLLVVNDAMGALEGLRRLDALGRRPLAVGTLRQNPRSLAARLAMPPREVLHPGDEEALRPLLAPILARAAATARTPEPDRLGLLR